MRTLKWSKTFEGGPTQSAMQQAMKVVRWFKPKSRAKMVHSIELVDHQHYVRVDIEFYPTRHELPTDAMNVLARRLVTGK